MRLEATRYSIAERVRGYGFDTALASAAIAVATFTMVFLVSLVGSAFEMMTTGLRRVGSDLLFVTEDMSARTLRQLPRRLTLADAEALSKLPVGISEVGASLGMFAMASGCGQSQVIRLLGVTETQRELEGWVVAEGRFVSVTDVRQRQAVAVLGASVLKRPGCAADERSYVRIGSHQLRVTGRLASRGKVFGANLDDIVLMPITSMTSKFGREDMNVDLTIKLEPGAVASAVSAQVRALLRYRHRLRPGDPDDILIQSQGDLLGLANQVRSGISMVVFALVGVSLVVAAINVLSSVYARVLARRSEIGLRRALGATRSAICVHFLGEALVISTIGAVIGPSLALLLFSLVASILDFPAVRPWWLVGLASVSAVLLGTAGGLMPAMAAARQEPVEALRYE